MFKRTGQEILERHNERKTGEQFIKTGGTVYKDRGTVYKDRGTVN